MSAISSGLFPPSNRRRCVKARTSYAEPSDNFIPFAPFNNDLSNESINQNDCTSLELDEVDDVEEEPITIDLSAFLSENPLLTETAVENAAENNVPSVESNSQFRVTDCEIKPSDVNGIEIPKTDLDGLSTIISSDVYVNNTPNENPIPPLVSVNNIPSNTHIMKEMTLSTDSKENCPTSDSTNLPLKNNFINTMNDISINGQKTPIKKFTKAKPLGLSNPLRKYRNFIKSKDFNKTNMKVFGKYPVVKCERLDIEHFVKNNKIKVTNWPLHNTSNNQKNNRNIQNKNSACRRINLTKTLKPKVVRKPMSFNKLIINSNKRTAVNSRSSILVDPFDSVSKTVVIKTGGWNPEITKTSTPLSEFFRSPVRISTGVSKSVLCSILKEDNLFSNNFAQINNNLTLSPEKNFLEKRKGPFITCVNKVCNRPKAFQFIAPKPVDSQEISNITPNLPKPVIEAVSQPISKDYTVIEPYVEDPASPLRPKPILTVPVEIIPSPEKQKVTVQSNSAFKVTNSRNVDKTLKGIKSVFLNGAIKQISTLSRPTNEVSSVKEDKMKIDGENISNKSVKVPVVVNKNGESSEDHFSVLKAKNVVVDAMQTAFTTMNKIKKSNPRIVKKSVNPFSDSPKTGCSTFNSTLNDLLFGFSETDFDDSCLSSDESHIQNHSSRTLSTPKQTWFSEQKHELIDNVNEVPDNPNNKKNHIKRKRIFVPNSPNSSDTLSASECENENSTTKKKPIRTKLKKHHYSSDNISDTSEFTSLCDLSNKSGKLDFPEHSVNNISPENIYLENNKDFEKKQSDSSVSFSASENSTNNKHSISDSSVNIKNSICLESNNSAVNNVEPSLNIKNNSPFKQETFTRTLRERKSVTTFGDKVDSIKQSPHSRESHAKNYKLTKHSINSKLKIQMKTPPRSTAKVKIKNKYKDSDIIQEIATITNAPNNIKKNRNKMMTNLDMKNSDDVDTDDVRDSGSDISSSFTHEDSRTSMSRKKKNSLKVQFKPRKKKKSSCLEMPLNSLTDVLENNDNTSSISKNNGLHSSFREGKDEKMGTPCKHENVCENDASISDSNMDVVEKDKSHVNEEQFLVSDNEDLMVNSSEISLSEDQSVINSDLSSLTTDMNVCHASGKLNDILDKNCRLPEVDMNECVIVSKSDSLLESSKGNLHRGAKYLNTVISHTAHESVQDASSEVMDSITSNNTDADVPENIDKNSSDSLCECNDDLDSNSKDNIVTLTASENVQNESSGISNIDVGVSESIDKSESNENNLVNSPKHNLATINISHTTCENSLGGNSEVINSEKHDSSDSVLDVNRIESNSVKINPALEKPENTLCIEGNILNQSEKNNVNDDLNNSINISKLRSTVSIDNSDALKLIKAESEIPDFEKNKISNLMNNYEDSFSCRRNLVAESSDDKATIVDNNIEAAHSDQNHAIETVINNSEVSFSSDNCVAESSDDKATIVDNSTEVAHSDQNHAIEAMNNSDDSFSSDNCIAELSDNKAIIVDNSTEDAHSDQNHANETIMNNSDDSFSSDNCIAESSDDKAIIVDNSTEDAHVDKNLAIETEMNNSIDSFSSDNCVTESLDDKATIADNSTEVAHSDQNHAVETDISLCAVSENEGGSNEQFNLALSDNEQGSISENNVVSNDIEKSSPNKLKISIIKKSDNGNPHSKKSWYVCESKQSMNTEQLQNTSDIIENASTELAYFSNNKDKIDLIENKENKSISNIIDKDSSAGITDNVLNVEKSDSVTNISTDNIIASSCGSSSTELCNETENDKCQISLKESVDYKEKEVSSSVKSYPEIIADVNMSSCGTAKKRRGRPRKFLKTHDVTNTEVTKGSPEVSSEASSRTVTPKQKGQKSKVASPGKTSATSGRKKNYDPELVCVPFFMGWMREHVIRGTESKHKRQSDIYYFGPDGTKLRSMPDIASYLSRHKEIKLSLSNFTFAKELIFREPFEHERDAARPLVKKASTPTTSKKNSESKTPISSNKKKSLAHVNSENVTSSSLGVLANSKEGLLETTSFVPITRDFSDKKVGKRKSSSLSREIKTSTPLKSSTGNTETLKFTSRKRKLYSSKLVNESENGSTEKIESGHLRKNEVPNNDDSFENKSFKKQRLVLQRNTVSGSITISNLKSVNKKSENKLSNNLSDSLKESELFCVSEEKISGLACGTKDDNISNNKRTLCTTEGISKVSSPVRISTKSSVIQNRLKVKFAPRKSDLLIHNPCTKYCNFASYIVPSIKCTICLCLFHPDCIPFRPIGQTKYACVPCVKTKINIFENEPEALFPENLDISLLYPDIILEMKSNSEFDSTFNKFYPLVDKSSVCSNEDYSADQHLHQFRNQITQKTVLSNADQYTLNKSNVYPLCHNQNIVEGKLWHPPNSNDNNINASKQQQTKSSFNLKVANVDYFQQIRPKLPAIQSVSINLPTRDSMLKIPVKFVSSVPESAKSSTCVKSTLSACHEKIHTNSQYNVTAGLTSQNIKNSNVVVTGEPNIAVVLVKNPAVHNIKNMSLSTPPAVLQNTGNFPRMPIFIRGLLPHQRLNISSNQIFHLNNNNIIFPPSFTAVANNCISSEIIGKSCDTKRSNSDEILMCNKKLKISDNTVTSEDNAQTENNSKTTLRKSEQYSAPFWDISTFSKVYECMNLIFKFLSAYDLLRASLVCRSWRHLATQKFLWETVSFSGLKITDWDKCCLSMQRLGTRVLDFRGIDQDSAESWRLFAKNINNLTEVKELIFDKVPPFIINAIADCLPQLKNLTCDCLTDIFTEPEIWSTPCSFELTTLRYLGRLQRLKISSMGGILLKEDPQSLMPYLPNLTHLVLTGFKFRSYMNLECLSQQQQLLSLELGDCDDIEPQIYGIVAKLTNLQCLCLQNGGITNDSKLPEAISKMKRLETLELMNFKVSSYLSDVIKNMEYLCHVNIWPDNRSEAALINFNSFSVVTSCSNLKTLCWGILSDDDNSVPETLELKDPSKADSDKLTLQELFQTLVKHFPDQKVDMKCIPRNIWSEYCSTRNFA